MNIDTTQILEGMLRIMAWPLAISVFLAAIAIIVLVIAHVTTLLYLRSYAEQATKTLDSVRSDADELVKDGHTLVDSASNITTRAHKQVDTIESAIDSTKGMIDTVHGWTDRADRAVHALDITSNPAVLNAAGWLQVCQKGITMFRGGPSTETNTNETTRRKIMSDNGTSGNMMAIVLGALAGAGIALLYAPRTGKQTRELIVKLAGEAQEKANDAVEYTKDFAHQRGEDISAAYEAGKDMLGSASDAGKDMADTANEAGKDMAGTAYSAGKDMKDTASTTAREMAGSSSHRD